MPVTPRQIVTHAAVLMAGAATVLSVAGPAVAKSSLELSANRIRVADGGTVRLTASGSSDDFGGDPMRLCVEQRTVMGTWRVLRCGAEGTLELTTRVEGRGVLLYRAQLLAVTSPGHVTLDRTSNTLALLVR